MFRSLITIQYYVWVWCKLIRKWPRNTPNNNNQRYAVSSDWKICRRMCVNINGPGDLDLWPFDLETGMLVASKAAFEKSCRLIRLIWSPLLPFVYSIVSIRSIWICVRLLRRHYSEHDLSARSSDFERSDKRWRKKMVVSPADETTTCFIRRWRNVIACVVIILAFIDCVIG